MMTGGNVCFIFLASIYAVGFVNCTRFVFGEVIERQVSFTQSLISKTKPNQLLLVGLKPLIYLIQLSQYTPL